MTRNWAKISASTGYGTIKFTYPTDTLFTNVSNRTVTIAKSFKDANGKPLYTDYAITQDEKYLMFRQFTRDAIRKSFKTVKSLVNAVTNSLFITEDDSIDDDQLGFSIVDYEAYDDNVLDMVDHSIYNCLVFFILKEWYKYKNLGDFVAAFNAEYVQHDIDLNDNLGDLLKRTI